MIERAYIIDDDDISAFLTTLMLEADLFAHHIETFPHAEKALHNLLTLPREDLPEVVFLDLNMPAISGWELLNTLTAQESRYLGHCHFFILTSSVDQQEKERAKQYALVNGFLHKPLNDKHLSEIKKQFSQL